MADTEYTAALQLLTTKIDALADSATRREEMLVAINGHVREHGETLATHTEWILGHTQRHEDISADMHSLSSKVWALGGGSGILAALAMVLQVLHL